MSITAATSAWHITAAEARRLPALALVGTPPLEVCGDSLAGIPHYMGRLSAVARGVHLVPDPPMPVSEALALHRLSNLIDGRRLDLAPWIRQWLQDQLERTTR